VIEIKCPHCGAIGQIIVPPIGQIVVGPCPRCQELVALFEGRVFPLDKEIMIYGSSQEKREHVLSPLTEFLRGQVEELIPEARELESRLEEREKPKTGTKRYKPSVRNRKAGKISKEEIEDFLRIDLPLLAKKTYFEERFGRLIEENQDDKKT